MENQKGKTENWVNFPREIGEDYLEEKLKPAEYLLYLHIRLQANPYGYAMINPDGLISELAPFGYKASTIKTTLISLKNKRYIDYQRRQGKRGSFKVKFDEFILSGGKVQKLYKEGEAQAVKSENSASTPRQSEVQTEVKPSNQKLKPPKGFVTVGNLANQKLESIRSYHNDNENNNYNKNDTDKKRRSTKIDYFTPMNNEEQELLEIGKAIGEQDLKYLLSRNRQAGIGTIREAHKLFQQEKEKRSIENPPAYFNALLERIIKEGGSDKV